MKPPRYLLDTNACIAIRNSLRSIEPKDNVRKEGLQRFIARWRGIAAHDLAMSFVSLGDLAVWADKGLTLRRCVTLKQIDSTLLNGARPSLLTEEALP